MTNTVRNIRDYIARQGNSQRFEGQIAEAVINQAAAADPTNGALAAAGKVSGMKAILAAAAAPPVGAITNLNQVTTRAYADLQSKPTLGTAAALDVGTAASKVVQLDGSAKLPAVDGSSLLMSTLGTVDPHVVGALWNSTGTLKVSAG
jgi:hypothetical protein